MGRKKLTDRVPYMERTVNFATRCEKDSVEQFLKAFHAEKAYRRSQGKSYFLNHVMTEMFSKYVEEHALQTTLRDEAIRIAEERGDADVNELVKRALEKLGGKV